MEEKLDAILAELRALNLFLQERISYMEDVDSALLRLHTFDTAKTYRVDVNFDEEDPL